MKKVPSKLPYSSLSKPARKKERANSRRRDGTKHQAILQATRELLEEKGFTALTLTSIASRSKVSRNVLYNWWEGDINRIVEEALLPNVKQWPMPDNGNFKADIEQFLELTIEAMHKPNVLKGVLILAAEVAHDKSELTQTSKYFRAPYARMVSQIIKNAEKRDEIAKGLEAKHIARMISGSVLQFAISKNPGKRKTKAILSEYVLKIAAK